MIQQTKDKDGNDIDQACGLMRSDKTQQDSIAAKRIGFVRV